ncbi:PREDICTED: proline-rich receptor-like protein kinase PERK3 isoform X2 [Nelumbo nucifera]|uniref:non-specific serine/threonine protein kinase n=1 Tax=Nelumbo nucifera TaxID=4432 RepID=A0A1U7Z8Z5_NELNU|nr:PREDICTED: proline-rich receptor-like protein kinase PERK3 isoform X2 [Nelumbo nucifera]
MSRPYGAMVACATGGIAFFVTVTCFIWFCRSQCKKHRNRNSETSSSDPSAVVESNRRHGFSSEGATSIPEVQGVKQFTLEELEQATKHFSKGNLIGKGSFGLVYKGLLSDGTIVAIKRRQSAPRQEFVNEVLHLSEVKHRNIVTLLGFCQEDGSQMLVFEYVPNGSLSSHIYVFCCLSDNGQESITTLEFKQRLSIALGAAKGLCHLHSLIPPVVHKNFRMSNVLVDENFIAKVADAGISKLLERIEDPSSSSQTGGNVFQDPEVRESRTFSEMSDVYSFGIFLLELITGQETLKINSLGSHESLMQWVKSCLHSNNFVDHRLASCFTLEGMKNLTRLMFQCMNIVGKGRPKMDMVMLELERILENEMTLTTVMGDGTATVTLGSQLFTSG